MFPTFLYFRSNKHPLTGQTYWTNIGRYRLPLWVVIHDQTFPLLFHILGQTVIHRYRSPTEVSYSVNISTIQPFKILVEKIYKCRKCDSWSQIVQHGDIRLISVLGNTSACPLKKFNGTFCAMAHFPVIITIGLVTNNIFRRCFLATIFWTVLEICFQKWGSVSTILPTFWQYC